ncbi:hypothetical protein F8388_014094 [Cannabis sativa]|uniref:Uncharacterized protein n=1 Tax=Cannabis sativa TaxID=3483 RepID=A0A7J6GKZ1_CANSA|nr:hypothetical protein F8388_014094 [Cannabis sativa]
MDGFGSGSGATRYGGVGDRRHDIVSGKSYGTMSQVHHGTTRVHSPDPGPVPARTSRASRADLKPWSFGDPEAKRKKRIYKYKVYTVEVVEIVKLNNITEKMLGTTISNALKLNNITP